MHDIFGIRGINVSNFKIQRELVHIILDVKGD